VFCGTIHFLDSSTFLLDTTTKQSLHPSAGLFFFNFKDYLLCLASGARFSLLDTAMKLAIVPVQNLNCTHAQVMNVGLHLIVGFVQCFDYRNKYRSTVEVPFSWPAYLRRLSKLVILMHYNYFYMFYASKFDFYGIYHVNQGNFSVFHISARSLSVVSLR